MSELYSLDTQATAAKDAQAAHSNAASYSVFDAAFAALSAGQRLLVIQSSNEQKNAVLGTLGARLVIAGFGKLLRLRGNQRDFLTVLSEQLKLERHLPLEEAILQIPHEERYIVMVDQAELLDISALKILQTMLVASGNLERICIVLFSERKIDIPADKHALKWAFINANSMVCAEQTSHLAKPDKRRKHQQSMGRLVQRLKQTVSAPTTSWIQGRLTWPKLEHLLWGMSFVFAAALAALTWFMLLGSSTVDDAYSERTAYDIPIPEPVAEAALGQTQQVLPKPYVNQVFGSWSQEKAEQFINKHQLHEQAGILVTERLQKPWYIVTLGAYENIQDAKMALGNLPADLRQYNPWIRAMEVQ